MRLGVVRCRRTASSCRWPPAPATTVTPSCRVALRAATCPQIDRSSGLQGPGTQLGQRLPLFHQVVLGSNLGAMAQVPRRVGAEAGQPRGRPAARQPRRRRTRHGPGCARPGLRYGPARGPRHRRRVRLPVREDAEAVGPLAQVGGDQHPVLRVEEDHRQRVVPRRSDDLPLARPDAQSACPGCSAALHLRSDRSADGWRGNSSAPSSQSRAACQLADGHARRRAHSSLLYAALPPQWSRNAGAC